MLHNVVFDTEESMQYRVCKICCQSDVPQKTSPTLSILHAHPADLNVKTTKKALVPSIRWVLAGLVGSALPDFQTSVGVAQCTCPRKRKELYEHAVG